MTVKYPWLRHLALSNIRKIWNDLVHPQPVSLEYRQWCDRLIKERFWLAIALAIIYTSIQGLADVYELFINPARLIENLELVRLTHLLATIRQNFILHKIVVLGLLGLLILFWQSVWGRKYPAAILVLMPWAIAFIPEMVLGGYLGIPRSPSIIMFMAQVAFAPIHWRLHLIAQVVPIAFFFTVYPLIGLETFGGQSIYSFSYTVELILVCILCEISVYLYEQSKRSELEANRRLQLCIHAITHDLRTPVMGSLMLLKSIRDSSPIASSHSIDQTELEQLINGGDRTLGLMNALLDTQGLFQAGVILNPRPTHLNEIATAILQDFHPLLVKQNIRVNNQICSHLPMVNADPRQIWRVFNNLIGNAIIHNSSGLLITLDAVPVGIKIKSRSQPMLKVIVRDNGVGISPTLQKTIFEPYTRGKQTEYLPGLGLGLYICRQIVEAHGGVIEFEHLNRGTTCWFALPLSNKQIN
ncbi:MAG: sensor histidine kinase [Waterburya sp.]